MQGQMTEEGRAGLNNEAERSIAMESPVLQKKTCISTIKMLIATGQMKAHFVNPFFSYQALAYASALFPKKLCRLLIPKTPILPANDLVAQRWLLSKKKRRNKIYRSW